jgi:hypothetical protein
LAAVASWPSASSGLFDPVLVICIRSQSESPRRVQTADLE